MSEFNLVPEEFRQRDMKRTALSMLGGVLAAVLVLSGGAFLFASTLLGAQEEEVRALREQKALSMQQQERLKTLQERKEKLRKDVLLLSSLQSGATVPELVHAIENALPGQDVRFLSWQFRREGIRTEEEPQVRPPSYFFVLDDTKAFPTVWESMTHMTIHGVARDHGTLSRFVQNLFEDQTVDDVRIQRSTQGEHGVEFHLAVVVRSAEDHS